MTKLTKAEFLKALKGVVDSMRAGGRNLMRARVLYRGPGGKAEEEPVICRKLGEHEIRPVGASWRVERLDKDGKRKGRFLWLSEEGERV